MCDSNPGSNLINLFSFARDNNHLLIQSNGLVAGQSSGIRMRFRGDSHCERCADCKSDYASKSVNQQWTADYANIGGFQWNDALFIPVVFVIWLPERKPDFWSDIIHSCCFPSN
jgi:hypothetical protein